jgi:hypothetical protein
MDPKLAILFLLISTVIGLAHFGEGNADGMRHQSLRRRWRVFVPGRRKS